MSDRVKRTAETFRDLFDAEPTGEDHPDFELMQILQRQIFGEVFHRGTLDQQTRELITLVALTALGNHPQVSAHTQAALNAGLSPLQIREAIYQCAPFIGYPTVLNAVTAMNATFESRGIELPLDPQATSTEQTRLSKGREVQVPLYGAHMKKTLREAEVPEDIADFMADQLTANCFGDFYTRKGLSIAQRELLVIVILASLGSMEAQLYPHLLGNLKAGNSKETVLEALVQAYPYIGFPKAINAIRLISLFDAEADIEEI